MNPLNNSTKKTDVLGIPVSTRGVGSVQSLISQKLPDKSLIITFVNPHACYLDSQDSEFADTLADFDVVACDGIGMVLAARACGCAELQRESFDFTSLAGDVLKAATKHGWPLGLVGGKPGVSNHAAKELMGTYPGLTVAACYSGYGDDPDEACRFFTQHQTKLVICGMGAPLQEKFLTQLVSAGWHGTGFTCGGFLDQTISWKNSYPEWIDKNDMRFLYRLFKEPRRLWRRYLIEYQVFVKRYCKLRLSRAKLKLNGDSEK
jgi:exopolysaccharide biosynthesis WecB/TagA/CpsF family protein